ncbi:twin-arginine translocase subunit TatC [Haloarcula japonica]|uniref:Sec-independent protein translocase protein TatC n=1 Tax=Haloarcula japonica (strain ATCC 49778 / DSM 6131 / JCM 7785 / NBRC 101032 / NCIMB 13157 / TR-1) TaxID=1227453 RepID=M0LNF6_HALJT|nr:twin-arginine translocase subunit TatC [Haloarcula japonica]EMA35021.1 Sec-independent protein translocase component TatC2 [Haloarcula japonica DSM 6131]
MEDGDADDERRGPDEPPLPSDDESDDSSLPTDPVAEADANRETDDVTGPGPAPAGGDEHTIGSHAGPTEAESSDGLFDRDASEVTAAVPADVPTDWGKSTPSPAGAGGAAPTTGGGNAPTYDPDDDIVDQGAPDDEEMPLADHVEEMAMRLFVVVGVMAVVAVIALPYSDELINFLWYSFLDGPAEACGQVATNVDGSVVEGADCPNVYNPLALILARLKVSSLVGFIAALPVFVYQTYLFMRPGLYPRERRYYLAAVPTSLVLAAVGVGFAYFAVLRAMFDYFITYSDRAADLAFGLSETFNLIILMLGLFALIFQIPLFVMLAVMMGVTTRQWLQDRRLYFWGGFAAVAFLFSPDPTGMAPLMVAVTMIGLFEGTLLLLRWTGSTSPVPTADDLAARRPAAWAVFGIAGYVLSPAPVPTGYYEQLPAAVTETLAAVGLGNATPMLVGGGMIVLFEALAYVNKNYYGSVKLWRGFRAARLPVWAVAIVVGYLGSPDPTLFRLVNQFSLPRNAAIAVAVGLVLLYEGTIAVARWRSGEEA